jgi:hypothetical protein
MEVFLVVFPVAIGLLGYLCWGLVGLLLAFWIGLLWFSLVHQPRRHELTLISGLGLIGAFAFLPNAIWMKPHLVLAFYRRCHLASRVRIRSANVDRKTRAQPAAAVIRRRQVTQQRG